MSAATHHAFSSTAASYDEGRSRLIPGFAAFYGCAVDLVPAHAAHILDLGAGTGLLSALLRARLPQAHLHLVDLSSAMLTQAQNRFRSDPRVTFTVGDYSRMVTDGAISGSYDAVVSALSIHHLPDASKRELFRAVHALLPPGGVFLNAEQVLAPTPALEQQCRQEWLREVRALGATEQQVRDSLFRQEQDRCATVEDQLSWMREAGFMSVTCPYRQGRFAVLAGTKAASL